MKGSEENVSDGVRTYQEVHNSQQVPVEHETGTYFIDLHPFLFCVCPGPDRQLYEMYESRMMMRGHQNYGRGLSSLGKQGADRSIMVSF